MKRLMRERDHLCIVDDQCGVPTTTDFLADVAVSLMNHYQQDEVGSPRLIHAVPDGETSWFGFACHIRQMLVQQDSQASLAEIKPIPSAGFPQAATRPSNSVMSNVCNHVLANRSAGGKTGMTNSMAGKLCSISL